MCFDIVSAFDRGVTGLSVSFDSFVYLLTVTPDRLSDPSMPRCQTNCLIDCYFFPSARSVLGKVIAVPSNILLGFLWQNMLVEHPSCP